MSACKDCRSWSSQVAKQDGGILVAVCLNPFSPANGEFTRGDDRCAFYGHDTYGKLDEPGISENAYKSEAGEGQEEIS